MILTSSHTSKARKRRFPDLFRSTRSALLIAALYSSAALASPTDEVLADLSLEDLLQVDVSSASRFTQPIEEAPASVTVIGEEELRQRGYRNLAEALITVPGVYSSNDRSYTFLGVRGFNRPGDFGSRILLLTDGARRNDPLFDQAVFGHEAPIEIDWVKRLEFVAGPASAIYGSNALFGTANAVMLSGSDINGSRITLDVGTENTRRLGLVAGQRLEGDRDWFIGFAAYKSKGSNFYYPEYDNSITDGHARGLDGEDYQKAYAKYRWENWRLAGNFSLRNKTLPTAPYETEFGKHGTRIFDENRLLELRYDGELNNDWQPSFRVYSGSYRFGGNWHYSTSSDNRDRASASWTGSEFHMAYTGFAQHKLIFGIDAQWNKRLDQQNYDINPRNSILDINKKTHTTGLFVQDEWRFHPELLLNIGLRHDKHSDFQAITSPRTALIWQATPRFSLKAIISKAYRTPNANERFYSDANSQESNPELKPEHIKSSELAGAYRFSQNGRIGLSIYNNRMNNLIDQATAPSGLAKYMNQSTVKARGIELSSENSWAGAYRLRGSLAWQQSIQTESTAFVDSPKILGKLIFGLPITHGWSAAGEVLGSSERKGVSGTASGYGIVNLSLSSTPVAGLGQFALTIHNLGNRRYADPASANIIQRTIEQDGRQIYLRWSLAL